MRARCPMMIARINGPLPHGVFQCTRQAPHAEPHQYEFSSKGRLVR